MTEPSRRRTKKQWQAGNRLKTAFPVRATKAINGSFPAYLTAGSFLIQS